MFRKHIGIDVLRQIGGIFFQFHGNIQKTFL